MSSCLAEFSFTHWIPFLRPPHLSYSSSLFPIPTLSSVFPLTPSSLQETPLTPSSWTREFLTPRPYPRPGPSPYSRTTYQSLRPSCSEGRRTRGYGPSEWSRWHSKVGNDSTLLSDSILSSSLGSTKVFVPSLTQISPLVCLLPLPWSPFDVDFFISFLRRWRYHSFGTFGKYTLFI